MLISPPGPGAVPSSGVSEPLASVTLPVERYMGVARLVTAGVGARLDLPFDAVDDLQLAVELVMGAAFSAGHQATVSFATDSSALTISISPLDPAVLETTRGGYGNDAPVRLRDLLERLVDSVETTAGPMPAVTMRKALEVSQP